MKNIKDIWNELRGINERDCTCDTGPPWATCIPCEAGGVLNESAEILRTGYAEILDRLTAIEERMEAEK